MFVLLVCFIEEEIVVEIIWVFLAVFFEGGWYVWRVGKIVCGQFFIMVLEKFCL